jgi:hypothetical protein
MGNWWYRGKLHAVSQTNASKRRGWRRPNAYPRKPNGDFAINFQGFLDRK